ncbi:hypothetical protein JTY93_15325 [Pseudomonas hygromyciniae]|uniref:Uncharacterized protein n=1 Tax=Pseudomonas hygromyciniae TaxID=2812000 RepID=A0ABX7JRT6_9PSED|nr:hypothetical protein [Pseudomonas hygromyciniae]MBN0975973.1 hypothetical protein [Pseudomonas hygromyciniae]QSB37708.1 hypothetical protein JTY93_15325 [Pseudomonas hygromyciniae]
MKQDIDSNHFNRWPYIPELRDDGDRNNGGIDLIENPDNIALIHEATEENGLRPLLVELNKPDGRLMSLGCASGLDGSYDSYVEFTLRDHSLAINQNELESIYSRWLDWQNEVDAKHPGFAKSLREHSVWETRTFSLRGNEPQHLITVYHRAPDEANHRTLAEYMVIFLRSLESSS